MCLAGCGESGRGLRAYRDPEIALPAAKTGIKPGSDRAPTGSLCIINVRRDGSIWTRRGDTPTTMEELPRLIAEADASKGCLVLRCDKNARWKHVAPVLVMLARAKIPKLWFCVETEGMAFLDYEFPLPSDQPDLRTELWVRIKTMGKGDVADTPWLALDQFRVKDWGQLEDRLRRYASIPGAKDELVVLEADQDAFLGWVIQAIDCLRGFGLHEINFLDVEKIWSPGPPEELEQPPVEDIPIEPEPKSVK